MKKLMAVFCAGAMAVSLAVPSFAAYTATMTNGDQFRVAALRNGTSITGSAHTGGTDLTGLNVYMTVDGKRVASYSAGRAKRASCSSSLTDKGTYTIKVTGSGTLAANDSYKGTDTLRTTVR